MRHTLVARTHTRTQLTGALFLVDDCIEAVRTKIKRVDDNERRAFASLDARAGPGLGSFGSKHVAFCEPAATDVVSHRLPPGLPPPGAGGLPRVPDPVAAAELFRQTDTDGDGTISLLELTKFMRPYEAALMRQREGYEASMAALSAQRDELNATLAAALAEQKALEKSVKGYFKRQGKDGASGSGACSLM